MPLDEHEIATLSTGELHAKLLGFRMARGIVVALAKKVVEMEARAAASGAIETNSDAALCQTTLQETDADIESLERAIHERASPAETSPNFEEQAVETAEGGAVEAIVSRAHHEVLAVTGEVAMLPADLQAERVEGVDHHLVRRAPQRLGQVRLRVRARARVRARVRARARPTVSGLGLR